MPTFLNSENEQTQDKQKIRLVKWLRKCNLNTSYMIRITYFSDKNQNSNSAAHLTAGVTDDCGVDLAESFPASEEQNVGQLTLELQHS